MYPFWAPEGEGDPGGGAGGGGVTPPGTGSGGGGGSEQALSLRAQMASQLGEEERGGFSKWADGYTTDKEFVLGAMNMRQQFDARVPVPGENAKPEEWDKYFQRVGKPPEAKAYAYDFGKDEKGAPRELPDGDRARFEAFKEHAHAHHYTQKQFEAGVKFLEADIAKQESEFVTQLERAQDDSIKHLKQEWGPDYDSNLAAATDGGVAFAPDEASWVEFVNLPLTGPNGTQIKVGDHPTFLKAWAKVGRSVSEDQRVRDLRQSGEADNIQTQILAIEDEAIKANKSTASEPYASRLRTLYKKLTPNTPMNGSGRGGYG
jgi:hypothetical protein